MARENTFDDETRKAVESFVADWVTESEVPSASVAVVDGEDVAYLNAFGARDLESNAPATPDTLYGVASITKSVAATAVLQLVDGGRVGLDDPVAEYVDFFENAGDPPTVHELLTHSSGMPSDGSSVAMAARLLGEGTETAPLSSDADFRRHVEQSIGERVTSEPPANEQAASGQASSESGTGDRFFYYNTGYEVLGKLVESVDGRPFPEYVDDEILAPLGMDRSVVRADPREFENGMTPYLSRDDGLERADFPVKGVGAAGGLVSSARDLATYLRFAMGGGVGASEQTDSSGEHVLPNDLRERAQAGHVVRGERVDGTKRRYGYGWMRRSFLGDDLVGHGGTLSVTSAYLGFLADRELGVAVLANTAPDVHPMYVAPAVLALVEGTDPTEVVSFHALRGKCERVAGTYESYRGIATADVEADGSGISVTVDTALGTETLRAQPTSLDRHDVAFEAVSAAGDRVPVTFEETEDGVDLFVRRWRLHAAD